MCTAGDGMSLGKEIWGRNSFVPRSSHCSLKEEGLVKRSSVMPFFVVSVPNTGVSNTHKAKTDPLLVQNKEHTKDVLLIKDHSPPSVYLDSR